jgi:hypothetical protein
VAEFSEKLSDVIDPSIKYGGGEEIVRRSLRASSVAILEMEGLEADLADLRQAKSQGALSVESLTFLDRSEALLVETTKLVRETMEKTMRIAESFAKGGHDIPS